MSNVSDTRQPKGLSLPQRTHAISTRIAIPRVKPTTLELEVDTGADNTEADGVTALAEGPDDVQVGTTSGANRAIDLLRRMCSRTDYVHSSPITTLSTGQALRFSRGDDGYRISETSSGQLVRSVPEDKRRITCATIDKSDTRLAFGCDEGMLEVEEARTGTPIARYKPHTDRVTRVFFLDDEMLVSADRNQVVISHISTGQVVATFGKTSSEASPLGRKRLFELNACSLEIADVDVKGRCVLIADRDGVSFYDRETGQLPHTLQLGSLGEVTACRLSADGSVAALAHKHQITLWDTSHHRMIGRLKARSATGVVTAMLFTRDGSLLSGHSSGELVEWEPSSLVGTVIRPGWALTHVALHGNRVFTSDTEGITGGYDISACSRVFRRRGHQDAITAIAVSPLGDKLATGGSGVLRLSSTQSGGPLDEQPAQGGEVRDIRFRADGQGLLFSAGSTVVVWEFTGRRHKVFDGLFYDPVDSVAFVGNDEFLACSRGRVRHVSIATGDIRTWEPEGVTPQQLALVEEGQVVCVTADGGLSWHDLVGRLVHSLTIGAGHITAVAAGEGGLVATGGKDGFQLWDVSTNEMIGGFGCPGAEVASVSISGNRLVLANLGSTTLRIFSCDPFEHLGYMHSARDGRVVWRTASNGHSPRGGWYYSEDAGYENLLQVLEVDLDGERVPLSVDDVRRTAYLHGVQDRERVVSRLGMSTSHVREQQFARLVEEKKSIAKGPVGLLAYSP